MVRERAARLGEGRRLVGVLSFSDPTADLPVGACLINSGIIHRVGPNRLYVELARHLVARTGCPVLRFDLAGIGDSDGPRSAVLADSMRADIVDAVDWLCATTGVEHVVLMGLCSGADAAFLAASRDRRVVGVVLLDPSTFRTLGFHVRRAGRAAVDPRAWLRLFRRGMGALAGWKGHRASPPPPAFYGASKLGREEAARVLAELVRRRARVLYVFTGAMLHRFNHPGQLRACFRGVDFADRVRVVHVPDADHTFSRTDDRHALLEGVADWLAAARPAEHSAGPTTPRAPAPPAPTHAYPYRVSKGPSTSSMSRT